MPPERDCESVAELFAWYANGTLGAVDRAVVDEHVRLCAACRTTLALEQRIVESLRAPRDNVEQSPHAGWQKLLARLDSEEARQTMQPLALEPPMPSQASGGAASRWRMNWPAALGAAVAVQAAAIAVLAVALVRHRQVEEAPRFHTLANADPTLAAAGPLVRIAFDASVDERAARSVAAQAEARILSGPSPENVYTFGFADDPAEAGRLDAKVSELRRQAHVLLVEPVIVRPLHKER